MSNSNDLIPTSSHITISQDIVVRENKDGTVIVMKMDDSDLFYKIDGIAAKVFIDLKNDLSLQDVLSNIATTSNVDFDKIHNDASTFLNELTELKFITLA